MMTKKLLKLILLFIYLQTGVVHASGFFDIVKIRPFSKNTCEKIFIPTMMTLLRQEQILTDLDLYRMNQPQKLNMIKWYKNKKLRNLLLSYQITDFKTPKQLNHYILELTVQLWGRSRTVDDYLFKTPDQREYAAIEFHIKEQILKNGITQTWQDFFNEHDLNRLQKFRYQISSIWNQPTLNRFKKILPLIFFNLPEMPNQVIPDSLIVQVLYDGIDTHLNELKYYYRSQNKIDTYNLARKMFQPIIMATLFVVSYDFASKEIERQQQDQVKEVISSLNTSSDKIISSVTHNKQEIFEATMQAVLTEFKQKWGEDPTPEEYEKLKSKVINGIKTTNSNLQRKKD